MPSLRCARHCWGFGERGGEGEGALQKKHSSQICMIRTGKGAPEEGAANAEAGGGEGGGPCLWVEEQEECQ